MKQLILAAFLSGQVGLVHAEIVIQAGEKRFIFADSEKDSPMVKGFTQYAEQQNKALELHRQREQLKDELGLGELERMTVSGTEPSAEDLSVFRGANTDQLFTLLKNENFKYYWGGIAKTIGMVADQESLKTLAAFATTNFPKDSPARRRHIAAREGAVWGLALATRERPIPWVREFLISHADPEQWIADFGGNELDLEGAEELARRTRQKISRMANEESLAMLEEIRERHVAKISPQPANVRATAPAGGEQLEHIDLMIKHTQDFARMYAEQAERAVESR